MNIEKFVKKNNNKLNTGENIINTLYIIDKIF